MFTLTDLAMFTETMDQATGRSVQTTLGTIPLVHGILTVHRKCATAEIRVQVIQDTQADQWAAGVMEAAVAGGAGDNY